MAKLLTRIAGEYQAYAAHLLRTIEYQSSDRREKISPAQTSIHDTAAISVEQLSGREIEVLRLIAQGFTNQEIADDLTISLNTVKTHVKNILGRLQVTNRTQAVTRAREQGLI